MANSLNFLGGNAFYWVEKHNIAHHSFTNIDGADEDIDIYPYMRLNNNQKSYGFINSNTFTVLFFIQLPI